MSIIYDNAKRIFYLHTKSTSYVLGFLADHLIHIYWGKRISEISDVNISVPHCMRSQSPYNPDFPDCQNDNLPMEYPTFGSSDLRQPAFHAKYEDGSTVSEFKYQSHYIYGDKPKLCGLPLVTSKDDGDESLEIILHDDKTNVDISLLYTVFENKDAITRSVKVKNMGNSAVDIDCIMSASVDFYGMDFDLISLHGTSVRERHIQKTQLSYGSQSIDSKRGYSGHRLNPFIAIAQRGATETHGNVYAMNFVYSGNFYAGVEVDPYQTSRVFMGINPFDFSWKLDVGDVFYSPEVVMVFSDSGFGKMSRIYHKLYRENLCRSKFALKPRPVLINNWETTYFDFNEEKIVDIAKKASEIGVELMVLDDGWFGNRNDDKSSLGDWFVNNEKLPGGLDSLAKKIEALGMKFGLWFEPEMISPNSNLYREHPDWCIHVPGRVRSEGRNQLILDLANNEVCEYIIKFLSDILSGASISYVKWDMNRNMTESGSVSLPPERQREAAHRYILGLYHILDTITSKFPDILFESCAAGGGRFDPGMLYYMPQVWTSDNSDAGERMKIQYGTSFPYPVSSMGAHVSAVPNHQIHRTTSFKTRCEVAMTGQFGFELDLNKITDDELQLAKESIVKYKKIQNIVHFGDMYRIMSPFESNNSILQFNSEDENQVIVCICSILAEANGAYKFAKLENLDELSIYEDKENGIKTTGAELMNIGIPFRNIEDFNSKMYWFKRISLEE